MFYTERDYMWVNHVFILAFFDFIKKETSIHHISKVGWQTKGCGAEAPLSPAATTALTYINWYGKIYRKLQKKTINIQTRLLENKKNGIKSQKSEIREIEKNSTHPQRKAHKIFLAL